MEKKVEALFNVERETKRTRRFTEDEHPEGLEVIGTVYVQKHALAKIGNPSRIRVVIEPIDG